MRLVLLAPVLAASLLTACGGDAHDSATFASATDEQLRRVIEVARFGDVFEMVDLGEIFGLDQTGCPTVTTTGLVTTLTTDCTTSTGWAVTGSVVITNFGFETEPAHDPSQPSSVEAIGLRAVRGAQIQTLDGKVEFAFRNATVGGPWDLTASIDIAVDDLAAHTEGALHCESDRACRYDGAWIGVDTVGEAAIADGPFDGDDVEITLHGAQTMVIAAGSDDQGCVATTIDGAARLVCEPALRRASARWSSILR